MPQVLLRGSSGAHGNSLPQQFPSGRRGLLGSYCYCGLAKGDKSVWGASLPCEMNSRKHYCHAAVSIVLYLPPSCCSWLSPQAFSVLVLVKPSPSCFLLSVHLLSPQPLLSCLRSALPVLLLKVHHFNTAAHSVDHHRCIHTLL